MSHIVNPIALVDRANSAGMALAAFSLPIHSAVGEVAVSHRYCSEAVVPFMDLLATRPDFRVSVAASGWELEFLGEGYPRAMETFRGLIASGQIELISATYVPVPWWCYPRRDLAKAVELNRACLLNLGLKPCRIFWGRDGVVGAALATLTADFDMALCRAEDLMRAGVAQPKSPLYRLGEMPILVGANHLLAERARVGIGEAEAGRAPALSSFAAEHIRASLDALPRFTPETVAGETRGNWWRWYHIGGVHHFTSRAAPLNGDNFFLDREWMAGNVAVLDRLAAEGYRLAHLAEFAAAMGPDGAPSLPPVLEIGAESGTVGHAHRARRRARAFHPAVSAMTWASREAIRRAETQHEGAASRDDASAKLDPAWRCLLLAEGIAFADQAVRPAEVGFARQSVEEALRLARAESTAGLGPEDGAICSFPIVRELGEPDGIPVEAELYGAEGGAVWFELGVSFGSLFACEASLRVDEQECGIRFGWKDDAVAYCPSGLETQMTQVPVGAVALETIQIPLPNGLIRLAMGLFLIRVNRFWSGPVRLSPRDPWAVFAAEGLPTGKNLQWRFLIFRGTAHDAVHIANRVNWV